jgi:prepilin peptidase CpaA
MDVCLNLTLFAVIIVSGVFDIKERRIPNWIILVGIIGGAILGTLQGSTQLILSVAGFFAGIVTLLLPFAYGWIGAGDVKLFAAIGALLGYTILPRVFFYSSLIAGLIALFAIAMGHARQVSFKHFWIDCKFLLLTVRTGLPKSQPLAWGAYSVPWGLAIGAGTIMAYYFDPSGTWAGF